MSLPRSTLEQWSILAAVVDQGSFAQAAQALHRSQSAVSYAVARLQEALGVPLLDLAGRKAVLTPHGRTLLARSRGLVRDAQALERLAKSLGSGWEPTLHMVVDAAFPRPRLLAIIGELQISCPDTLVQWSEVVLSGAEEAILQGGADLYVTSRVPPGHLGDLILAVDFVAAARADHALLRLQRPLNAQDLTLHVQSVVRDSGSSPRDEGWLGAPRRFTVSSMEASLASLLAGLSFAWLPLHILAPHLESGVLQRLPLSVGATRPVSMYLVPAHPEAPGPALRAAIAAFKR
jgi:DNA-binding transcriptional LysR family regulator